MVNGPLFINTDLSFSDVESLIREAIGTHYDVLLEQEPAVIDGRVHKESVIRVYEKGKTGVRLTLWLGQ